MKGRIDADRGHARDSVAHMLLDEGVAVQLAPLQREAELAELLALGDPVQIAPLLPDDLLDDLTATGTAEQVLASLNAVAETGVDSIVFVPIGPDPGEQLRLLAEHDRPGVPRLRRTGDVRHARFIEEARSRGAPTAHGSARTPLRPRRPLHG